jgi:signal transduction histidine kinase/DNA-binding NarL/FixJ family response regulator
VTGADNVCERAIILAPRGRDADVATRILSEAGFVPEPVPDLHSLCDELVAGAGLAIIADEALQTADLRRLADFLSHQPPWSDFPVVVLTQRGGGPERNPLAKRLAEALGNVTFLERPFHPTTLASVVQTAIRGRRRQYEARSRLEELSGLAATLEERVAKEINARTEAEQSLRQSQKMEAVGQLTGGMAHDFNNLLTGIGGSLEMIQSRLAQGRMDVVDRYIAAGQNAVKRAASLTHRLLAFSRRQTLDPKPTNVNRLVVGMEELIRRTVGPSIQMEVIGAGGLWATLIDPNQLENALLNLSINARDAMPNGGRLTIETANKWLDERAAKERELSPGQYVSLCVTDTGTGMTPEVIAHAFEPFFTTKPFGQGTGLGLSMIYGFARQSGGQIRIYSELGKGMTMCLYLPRHDRNVEEEDSFVMRAGEKPAGDGEVVLVIDDEPTIRMLILEVLEEHGFSAIEASDGPSGMRILQSDARIDLLITDVGLPNGMNGRQVADAARELRPRLKVLFITGYAENAVVGNEHLDKGMQIIAKPFEMDVLARKIREIVEGVCRNSKLPGARSICGRWSTYSRIDFSMIPFLDRLGHKTRQRRDGPTADYLTKQRDVRQLLRASHGRQSRA